MSKNREIALWAARASALALFSAFFAPSALGADAGSGNAPVNWSPAEKGGTAELVRGTIAQGDAWDAFNEEGNAFARDRNFEGEYIYQVEAESAVFERRWEEPVEIRSVEIRRSVNELDAFKFHAYDPDEGEWREVIHERDYPGGDYKHTFDSTLKTDRMRFELITTDRDGLRLKQIRYLAPGPEK